MFVGGEFYADARWSLDKPALSTEKMMFLNGGKACLIVIADYLRAHGIHKILLPAFMPDITARWSLRVACEYYPCVRDLLPRPERPGGGPMH